VSPRPESAAQADLPTSKTGDSKRPWWKKYRASLIFAILGLAGLPVGFFVLYPSTPELPTPGYSQLVIRSSIPIGTIGYEAEQISAGTAKVTIRVSLPPGASGGIAFLTVLLPFGDTFINCYPPSCRDQTQAGSYLKQQLTFGTALSQFQTVQATPLTFEVSANHFGAIFNGVTASAVIPEVTYSCSVPATLNLAALLTGYKISSAGSYDWSSLQPQGFNENGFVVWSEDLAVGDTQSRVTVGINHAAQSHDDFMIFLAGAVIALAGAAILASIQEALHAGDRELKEPQARHPKGWHGMGP
jgi:hypothetical protein